MSHQDRNIMEDAFTVSMRMAMEVEEKFGIVGFGVVALFGPNKQLKDVESFANLITTAGDQYYAKKGIAGIGPAAPAAPTALSGMKLGSGATAAAKSGAGAALVTYIAASNLALDGGFPTSSAVGGDTGWNANYQCTYGAGVATAASITEAVLVNDAATDATSTAANTYARITFAAKNKGALDSLVIAWSHKFLGA